VAQCLLPSSVAFRKKQGADLFLKPVAVSGDYPFSFAGSGAALLAALDDA
jgi:hypothetical protein